MSHTYWIVEDRVFQSLRGCECRKRKCMRFFVRLGSVSTIFGTAVCACALLYLSFAILSSRRRVSVRWHSDACLLGWMEEHLPGEGRGCWREVGTHGHGGGGSRAHQHDISWNESTSSSVSFLSSSILLAHMFTHYLV